LRLAVSTQVAEVTSEPRDTVTLEWRCAIVRPCGGLAFFATNASVKRLGDHHRWRRHRKIKNEYLDRLPTRLNITIPGDNWIIGKSARRNKFCAEERLCQGNPLERDPFSTEKPLLQFQLTNAAYASKS
jgi:hypothetical protein